MAMTLLDASLSSPPSTEPPTKKQSKNLNVAVNNQQNSNQLLQCQTCFDRIPFHQAAHSQLQQTHNEHKQHQKYHLQQLQLQQLQLQQHQQQQHCTCHIHNIVQMKHLQPHSEHSCTQHLSTIPFLQEQQLFHRHEIDQSFGGYDNDHESDSNNVDNFTNASNVNAKQNDGNVEWSSLLLDETCFCNSCHDSTHPTQTLKSCWCGKNKCNKLVDMLLRSNSNIFPNSNKSSASTSNVNKDYPHPYLPLKQEPLCCCEMLNTTRETFSFFDK
ncbi:hypothetical protein HELRODRAFT_184287 [Helobdella robusta]|uniref:Uncharacterized protein n=1 Tax=Helobdella robusta TaxID=6412 RepID=T1FKX1_HELRO|nr:hypothetical protein HELRODRAFT_184287 [Helobdella robusta]ESO03244.1 hypothetical protein HELRODRAFT_184287 [Helobdella robusta]